MKAPTTLVMVAGAVVMAASGADARPMYARLDYHRYLQERSDTLVELQAWKMKFGDIAKKNGWMPFSEDRSADEDEEEQAQRFFLAKQECETAKAANPNANFSTDTPFSLMLQEEWLAASVSSGYRRVNRTSSSGSGSSTIGTERRLRGWGSHKSGGYAMGIPQAMSAPSDATTTTSTFSSGSGVTTKKTTHSSGSGMTYTSTTTTTEDGNGGTQTSTSWSSSWSSTFAPSTSTSTGSWGNGYDFSQLISDWMSQWGTVQPAGPSDSDSTSYTSAPAATTSAPAATTSAPAATKAPVATTSAPVATTSAPAATTPSPTTASPSTTTEDAATSTTTGSVASESDSSTVDWSSTTCMSPIQYQGTCGDCWAFASIAAVESAQCIANGQTSITKYSEQQLTSCDTQNYGCNGGAPVYAFEYIKQTGLCTQTDYPFTSDEGSTGTCSSSCTKQSTGITGFQQISTADELASVVAKQPVVVAVTSSNSAWKQYTGGVLSSCGSTALDHAVVVVGYTDTEWKIRNSWGEMWGEEGYVRLERTSDSDGVCGMYQDMSYPTTS